jgi:hypothetical protein
MRATQAATAGAMSVNILNSKRVDEPHPQPQWNTYQLLVPPFTPAVTAERYAEAECRGRLAVIPPGSWRAGGDRIPLSLARPFSFSVMLVRVLVLDLGLGLGLGGILARRGVGVVSVRMGGGLVRQRRVTLVRRGGCHCDESGRGVRDQADDTRGTGESSTKQ